MVVDDGLPILLFMGSLAGSALGLAIAARAHRLGKALQRLRVTVPQGLGSPPSGLVRLEGQVMRRHSAPGAEPREGAVAWAQARIHSLLGERRWGSEEPFQLRHGARSLLVDVDTQRVELFRSLFGPGLHLDYSALPTDSGSMETWAIPEGDWVTLLGWSEPLPGGGIRLGGGPERQPVLLMDGVAGAPERLLRRARTAHWTAAALVLGLAGFCGIGFLWLRIYGGE